MGITERNEASATHNAECLLFMTEVAKPMQDPKGADCIHPPSLPTAVSISTGMRSA